MKKIRLLYDGTILANGLNKNAGRSGIFFVALNILKEFANKEDVELILFCRNIKNEKFELYIKEILNGKDCKIIYDDFVAFNDSIKEKKLLYKYTHQYFNLFLITIFTFVFYLIGKIINFRMNLFIQKNCDIFFSPVYKIPGYVKIQKYTFLHDLIPLLFTEYHSMNWKKGEWLYDLCQSLNTEDNYFTNSDCTKNDFLKYFPVIDVNKIHTTLLACDESFKPSAAEKIMAAKVKYNIPQDKKYVFSLCTLEPRKNLIRTIKTFIQFIRKNNIDNLVFVLGGGHWESFFEQLNRELTNLGVYKDKIIQIGYVDDDDVASLYSGAEWFCYTSMYEGFGFPPLEAMSCGCPVITSNTSSIPEVVGDAGMMVDWDSDEQHLEAYEKYYYNEDLRIQNAKRGMERAKLFSWEKCVDEMLEYMKTKGTVKNGK